MWNARSACLAVATAALTAGSGLLPVTEVSARTAPVPPTGRVQNVVPFDTGHGIRLTWTNPIASFAGVTVRYAPGRIAPADPTAGIGVALRSARATNARLTGLAPGTRYSVAIWAYNTAHVYAGPSITRFTTLPMPEPDATISGTVTDSHHHPLQGVQVYEETYTSTDRGGTTTDANGGYSLTVHPGSYYVIFDGGLASGGNSDATGYVGRVVDLTLSGGEGRTGVDASLEPGAAISGRVTDAAGQPLAGVIPNAIPVLPYVDITGSSVLFSFAFGASAAEPSDADGRFVLKGMPATPLQICLDPTLRTVTGGDSDRLGYVGRCATRAVIARTRRTAHAADTQIAGERGGVITGAVTDAGGNAVAGAFVYATALGRTAYTQRGYGYTGADGTYRIHVAAGRYELCVDQEEASEAPGTCGPQVHVGRDQIVTADIRLPRGGALAGVITGPDHQAVSGALVLVSKRHDPDASGALAETDRAGRYYAPGLTPGDYRVCVEGGEPSASVPTGMKRKCIKAAFAVHVGLTRLGVDIALARGGAISGRLTDDLGASYEFPFIYVIPVRGAGWGDYTETVRDDGSYVIGGLSAGKYEVCFDTADFTTIGAHGCYGSSPGHPYRGKAVSVDVGRITTGIDIQLSAGGSITVDVHDRQGHPIGGVDVTAVAPCDVLDDACTTLPLFGRNRNISVDATDTTDSNGTVTLRGLAPGDHAICLFAYYGATATKDSPTGYANSCDGDTYDITVTNHQTTSVSRQLDAAGEVTGTVVDTTGRPLAGVRVTVSNGPATDYLDPSEAAYVDDLGGPATDAVTDAHGRYSIHGIPAGDQIICFDADNARGGSSTTGYLDSCVGGSTPRTATPVQIIGGQVTSGVGSTLVSGAAISGAVVNRDGHRVPASVYVVNAAGRTVRVAGTGRRGTYRISRLTAGTYRVCFSVYRYRGQCFDDIAWDGRRPLPGRAARIVLTAGVEQKHIDAIAYR
jgi:Carboxypeptidase regulatory-like domain